MARGRATAHHEDPLGAKEQAAILEPKPATEKAIALLNKLENDSLNDEQQQILAELRRCLTQPATEAVVNEQEVYSL